MADLGALGMGAGIAQGLASGVDAYMQTRRSLFEEAMAKKQANMQTLEAYSKVAAAGGTDKADTLFQQMGLIPGGKPQGYLPQQQTQQQAQMPMPTQPQSSGSSNPNVGGGNSPMGLAPHATPLDDSNKKPSVAGGVQPQGLAAAGGSGAPKYNPTTGLYEFQNMPPEAQRALSNPHALDPAKTKMYQEQFRLSYDPVAAQSYRLQANDPTVKADAELAPQKDRFNTAASTYMGLMDALKAGGPRSDGVILARLARLNNPQSPKSDHELIAELQSDPRIGTLVRDYYAQKTTGELSEQSKQDIANIGHTLYKNEARTYSASAKDAEFRWAPMGANPGFSKASIMDAANAYLPKGGTVLAKKSSGGSPLGTTANASPNPKPTMPPSPKAGTIMQGYRFKGGDPSKQSNWEAAQ